MLEAPIDGRVDQRFAGLREVFAETFRTSASSEPAAGAPPVSQRGAAVCVMLGDRVVVDLWGGFTDEPGEGTGPAGSGAAKLWQRDTLVNAFSVGKSVLAILALSCVEAGEVDLDAPVASLWPEFAAHGKDRLTLRSMMAHRSGLPAVREKLNDDAIFNWSRMAGALAAQEPFWEPDSDHGYHVNTQGFLVGEVLCRASGLEIGELLRRRWAGPLGADYYFGLPDSEHHRVSRVFLPDVMMRTPQEQALAFAPTGDEQHDAMITGVYFNPPGFSGLGTANLAKWRRAAIPSTNGHGNARGIAALHAAYLGFRPGVAGSLRVTDTGGPWPGASLRAEAATVHSKGPDRVLGKESTFGLGFQLPQEGRPFAPGGSAYGHYGYGGSLVLVDPDRELSFAFVTNSPGQRYQNQKAESLVAAVYDCLGIAA